MRVICAAHQDIPALIREDLYYRINEATIQVPPLRERTGDAVVLARAFLTRFANQQRRAVRDFSHPALKIVEHYAGPGNVRELENRVTRAVIMAEGGVITLEDLELRQVPVETQPFELREVRELAELRAIQRALAYSDNNMTRVAELLGVIWPTLYNLMKKRGFNC